MKHAALCGRLGYRFRQPQLLQRALTHRSYSAAHNERLEFLGDSVLNCTIAKFLYTANPDLPEGDLSRLRSNLVNQQTLATLAQQLELGEQLLLGEGERKSAGHKRPSILADALEAVFGAVILDADFAEAEKVILGLFIPYLSRVDLQTLGKDPKTLLQEFLQGRKLALPQYNVLEIKGEAHAQTFIVSCEIPQLDVKTRGEGASRRVAEQIAAESAYQQIANK
ncbi:MAG: ribonuclease III [Gammaproteobacteria bacterium]|nr:ribonuclease III [Gammaproteobacteria bacterium]MBU1776585.1 ribonuclease III [Gammaproteobacteria bacterium]MBU1967904.1 ribonuclease III [Gammaproteobacteria bacterium]